MAEARSERRLKLRNVAVWVSKNGSIILGCTDPDLGSPSNRGFITTLHGKSEQVVREALLRNNHKTS